MLVHCSCYICHGCQTLGQNQLCSSKALLFCPNSPHYKHKCHECRNVQTLTCPMLGDNKFAHCKCTAECCGCQGKNFSTDICRKRGLKKCKLSPFYNHECTLCTPENTCPYGTPYVSCHCIHAYSDVNKGCCGCNIIAPSYNECTLPSQTKCPDSVMYLHECEFCFAKFPWSF